MNPLLASNQTGPLPPEYPADKAFFTVTGVMLYYMAFVFAGKGIAELQSAQVVSLTVVEKAPRLPVFGIYPTLESLALQGVLLVLALVAVVWAMRPKPSRADGGLIQS